MAFPPQFLDEIRARVPLAEVVGRRVKLRRRGREHSGLCPFHNEKTPSFTVSEDKGFYHCFGCGAHGDVIGFVMESEGLSFPEAVERLAGEAGLEMPQRGPEDRAAAQRRADLGTVLETATDWFAQQLRGRSGAEARDYLAARGVDSATAEQFRLGYAPDRRGALLQAMAAHDIGVDLLAEAGLVKLPEVDDAEGGGGAVSTGVRDYFFNRLIFPIGDARGRVIAFGGRALGDSRAKYLNSPDTPLFHKGRVLYNLAGARRPARERGELLVTEGYMDVIALTQAGFPAAVAPLGTAVTEDQIEQLWKLVPEPTLCLDGDAAGQRAAFRALERALPLLKPGRSLRFATLPPGEDPDSLIRSSGPAAMRLLVDRARPMVQVLWQRETQDRRLDTPERRSGVRQSLFAAVKEIADEGVQEAYRTHLREMFDEAFGYRGRGAGQRAGQGAGRRAGPGWGKGGFGAGAGARGGRLGMALSPPLPASRDAGLLGERQEALILATLINHPDLLLEEVESLAHLRFGNREFDRLARALADAVGEDPGLDTGQLRCHLSDRGFDAILGAVLNHFVYSLGPFARPETSPSAVREGWLHLLAAFQDRRAEAARLDSMANRASE